MSAEREVVRLKLEELEGQQAELQSLRESVQREHTEHARQMQVMAQ